MCLSDTEGSSWCIRKRQLFVLRILRNPCVHSVVKMEVTLVHTLNIMFQSPHPFISSILYSSLFIFFYFLVILWHVLHFILLTLTVGFLILRIFFVVSFFLLLYYSFLPYFHAIPLNYYHYKLLHSPTYNNFHFSHFSFCSLR